MGFELTEHVFRGSGMVDYLLSVFRTRITIKPATVAIAIPIPAFHQTTDSP